MIIGRSGSGKTNYLLNSIQKDNNIIDKDLEEPKYQLLINKRQQAGIKSLDDPNAFIQYFNTMDDIFEKIDKKF